MVLHKVLSGPAVLTVMNVPNVHRKPTTIVPWKAKLHPVLMGARARKEQ